MSSGDRQLAAQLPAIQHTCRIHFFLYTPLLGHGLPALTFQVLETGLLNSRRMLGAEGPFIYDGSGARLSIE